MVPQFLRTGFEKCQDSVAGLLCALRGKNPMIPPQSMIFVGDGDFTEVGEEFKRYFINLAKLQPDDCVLDVGCGIGRMAVPLTSYLSEEGAYWGFDIVRKGISWCRRRITPRFKNFHFQHVDVYNKNYNPNGCVQAEDFRFPFEEKTFDFVFLTSVFTHMLPADMKHYLGEIARVLKPGGKCLITFFLLNEESERLIREGKSTLGFVYDLPGCKTVNEKIPEAAIAYTETDVFSLFEAYGLKIVDPIRYGAWCKRDIFLSYQDLVVAIKKP